MKYTIILLFFSYSLFGQTATFILNEPHGVDPAYVTPDWTINGVRIKKTKIPYKIKIHYPLFDTITVSRKSKGEKRIILTRFDINHTYHLRPPSCCHDLDVYDSVSLDKSSGYATILEKGTEREKDSLYFITDSLNRFNETGTVVFTMLNGLATDSICGTYGLVDGVFASGVLLRNNKVDTSDGPLTSEASGFCSFIKIASVELKPEKSFDPLKGNICVYTKNSNYVYVFKKELVSFCYRFFNREFLYVSYDKLTNRVKLTLKENKTIVKSK